MRRRHLFAIICSLCLLLGFTACRKEKEPEAPPPTVTGFSCNAAGTYRGEGVAGTLTRTAAGLLTVTLSKPDTLSGLTMEWNGTDVNLKLMGLSFSVNPDTVPEAALGKRILQSLDAVVYGQAEGTLTEDGRQKTEGTAGEGDSAAAFTVWSDPATGSLLGLEVPAEELSLTFSEFQRLEP